MTKNCVSDLLLLLSASVIIAAHAQRYDCDPCINREKVKLQAITHGTKSSTFWQQVQASMVQAAKDMRVDMSLQLYDSDAFNTTVMANDLLEAAGNDPAPDAIIETMYVCFTGLQEKDWNTVDQTMRVFVMHCVFLLLMLDA
jgi:ABC-type sugar transport system substrate-binding protein